jgi:hypothetical protein
VLAAFETQIKSVSFLPLADHGYEQAPYITIDQAEYLAAVRELRPLRLEHSVHEVVDAYCDGDRCEIPIQPVLVRST